MATKWFTNNWRIPRNANQNKTTNYSLDFDGSSRIDCGNDIQIFTQSHSYSFWVKKPTISEGYIFGYGIDSVVIFFGDGRIRFYTGGLTSGTDFYSSTSLSTNTWYHVCCTYEKNGDKKIYIDGSLDNTISTSGTIQTGGVGLTIAARNVGGSISHYFTGQLDGMCLFNYALSPSQVTYLHGLNNPMTITGVKPIAYYNIDSQTMSGTNTQLPNSAIGNFVIDTPGTANSNIVLPTQSSLGLSTANKMSFSIWYFLDASTASTTQGLFGYNYGDASGSGLYVRRSSNTINIVIGNNTLTSNFRQLQATDGVTNQWHHLAVVFDGTQTDADPATQDAKRIKMYLNGQETGALVAGSAGTIPSVLPNGGSSGTGNRNFRIGALEYGNATINDPWMGKLSNAQIWTSALQSTDVTTLYNSGSPLTLMPDNDLSTTALTWYKMDGTSSFSDTTTTWTFPNAAHNHVTPNYTTALRFDGLTDFINCGNNSSLQIAGSLTLSAWFKSSASTNQRIISMDSGSSTGRNYIIQLESSGYVRGIVWSGSTAYQGGTTSTTPGLNDGNWHHVALVYEPSTRVEIFIDGVSRDKNTSNIPSSINSIAQDLIIGRAAPATGNFFNGDLSNISIFNTSLTLSQVTTLFNSGTPEQDISFSPVSWWKLTSGSASGTIIDTQGINNGTNSNPGAETVNSDVTITENTLPATSVGYPASSLIVDSLITETGYSNSSLLWPQASSDKMTCGPSPITANSSNFTISVWIKKSDQLPTDHDVILCTGLTTTGSKLQVAMTCKDDDLYLFYNSDQALTGDYIVAKNALPEVASDPWWHCVFVKDTLPGSGKLYVNGTEAYLDPAATADFSVNPLASNTNFTIGDWDATSKPFYGNISNISIHGVSFTQGEVTELYNNGIPKNLAQGPQQAALKHWWPLDAGNSMWDEGTTTWYSRNVKDAAQEGAMPNSDISYMSGNAPNSFGNGSGSNLDISDFLGNAPDSINNAYSINMGYGDKQTL